MRRHMPVMGLLCMRHLGLRRALVRGAARLRFLACWLCPDSAPTVESVVLRLYIPDHGAVVVGIVDVSFVYMRNGGIVPELAAFPTSASEAGAEVAVTVIDAAVEAHLRPPIALVPVVPAAGEAPIAGSGRLVVDCNGRWRNVDRKLDSGKCERTHEGRYRQNQGNCEFVVRHYV